MIKKLLLFGIFLLTLSSLSLVKTQSALATCTLNGSQVATGTQYCIGHSYIGQVCTAGNTFGTCQANGTWSNSTCASGTLCAYSSPTNVSCLASCTGCTPSASCGSLGYTCGNYTDSCGVTRSCGACGAGQTCTSSTGGSCQSAPPTATATPAGGCTNGATRCPGGTGYDPHAYYQ